MNKINKAYAKLGKFIEEGIEGKDWYENSAKEILKAFDTTIYSRINLYRS